MLRLCILLFISSVSFAQVTGAFHQDHTFNNSDFTNLNRRFSFYIPQTYQANQAHVLIMALPGCGNASNDFRDDLRNIADSLNAIVACLDAGGDAITDEFNGREVKLLEYLYDSVQNHYNINTEAVYLTGFSCNGREAMRVVLEELTSVPFAGVLPYAGAFNTPNFNPPSFNRSHISPICLCMGTLDYFYTQVPHYHDLIDSLQARQAKFHEILMPNVRHTTAHPRFDEFMLDCFNYLEDNTTIGIEEESSETVNFEYASLGNLKVEVYSKHQDPAFIQVISLEGKVILEEHFSQKLSIRLPQKGIYILKMNDSESRYAHYKIAL